MLPCNLLTVEEKESHTIYTHKMTSVTQIWAKTLDQFPLLENLVFILYDNSFTSTPSFSSPSGWSAVFHRDGEFGQEVDR